MKVIVTGGTGFLGMTLARNLLDRDGLTGPSGTIEPIDSLVLFDVVAPLESLRDLGDRATVVVGNVADGELVRSIIDRDDVSVFHLASMVSGGCELDFDGALSTNLDGTRAVLEACRARPSRPRLVFSSSIAAFGGAAVAGTVSDSTKLTPGTTYGATKAICELLVNDYTRKGFLDGRSARLPTVVIRPGRPNAAASSWVSGVFREPLNGDECVVPVDAGTSVPLSGYRTVVENLVRVHEVAGEALGADRALNLPAIDVTAEEMITALRRATDRPLGPIHIRPDPTIVGFFRGWAKHSSFERATALGLARDSDVETIIRTYIEDFLDHK
jgi:nucleoside-diphosphate-sugar epimerase